VPAQRVLKPRKLKVYASCEVRCKLQFNAYIDNAPKPAAKGKKAKKRRTIMGKKVIKKQKRWVKVKRVGKEKRFSLKLTKKALRKLRKQLHRKGRAGITVKARMHSLVGNRVVKRRIVMRTYKKGERRR
jgi:phosphatidate phosphatase PAH1